MNYSSFLAQLLKAVSKYLPDSLEVKSRTVQKNNGVKRTGLYLVSQDTVSSDASGKACPLVYPEAYYDVYRLGRDMDWIASEVANLLLQPVKDIRMDLYQNWDYVKNRVVFRLVNRDANAEECESTLHRDFLDLTLLYGVSMEGECDTDEEEGFFLAKNAFAESWQVSEEEVYCQALRNSARIYRADLTGMNQILLKANLGMEIPDEFMYVLTNKDCRYGAAATLYSDKLQKLANHLETDLFILPSSVHEVIVLPAVPERTAFLRDVVREVNREQLAEEELLSDNIYRYSRRSGEISLVTA